MIAPAKAPAGRPPRSAGLHGAGWIRWGCASFLIAAVAASPAPASPAAKKRWADEVKEAIGPGKKTDAKPQGAVGASSPGVSGGGPSGGKENGSATGNGKGGG